MFFLLYVLVASLVFFCIFFRYILLAEEYKNYYVSLVLAFDFALFCLVIFFINTQTGGDIGAVWTAYLILGAYILKFFTFLSLFFLLKKPHRLFALPHIVSIVLYLSFMGFGRFVDLGELYYYFYDAVVHIPLYLYVLFLFQSKIFINPFRFPKKN